MRYATLKNFFVFLIERYRLWFFKKRCKDIFVLYEPSCFFIGNSLSYHNNMAFSAKNVDNNINPTEHCSKKSSGGWWYKDCYRSNLNGKYQEKSSKNNPGIAWFDWKKTRQYSMKKVEMILQPN